MSVNVSGVRVELAGRVVLEDIRLSIEPGELVGLIGPNGAGKTTLLRAILGLLPIAAGNITVLGRIARQAMGTVGYVPQRHEFAWDYPINVEKAVIAALAHKRFSRTHREVAVDALSQVDMLALRGRPVGELSGGQRQRVLVARALALRPKALLLDEPFTGLDVSTRQLLTRLLSDLCAAGTAVLMTTHDLAGASEICGRLCLLNRTVIADGAPSTLEDPAVWLRAFGVTV